MNEIKKISTYRTSIMGFSILWVIFYHIGLEYSFSNVLIGRIASLGYGGVDFFIFLSGFGLYYSYLKDNSITNFYKKRLRRILPEFIIITFIFCLINGNFSFTNFLIRISTVGFWFPYLNLPYNQWFVSAIILFYILFPIYMYYFQKHPKLTVIIGCILGFILTAIYSYTYFVLFPYEKNGLIFFTSRIPLFCIGVYFGKLSIISTPPSHTQQKRLAISIVWLSIIFAAILFFLTKFTDYWILRNGGLFYYPFIFIVPGGCLILSYILNKLPLINTLFTFIGKISFELYLVHEGLIYNFNKFTNNIEIPTYLVTTIIIVVSILSAYIVYVINKNLLNVRSITNTK